MSVFKTIVVPTILVSIAASLVACGGEESAITSSPAPVVGAAEFTTNVDKGVFVGTNLEAKVRSTVPVTYTWYVKEHARPIARVGEGKVKLITKDLFDNRNAQPNHVRYCISADSVSTKCSLWIPIRPVKPKLVVQGTTPFIAS